MTVISVVEQKLDWETLKPKKLVILEGRGTWWTRSSWDGKLVGACPCCCGAWNWALSSPLFSNDKFNVLCLQTQTSISQSWLSDPSMCWQRVLKLAKTIATQLLNPIGYETKLNIKNSAAIFSCNLMNIEMEYHRSLQTKDWSWHINIHYLNLKSNTETRNIYQLVALALL